MQFNQLLAICPLDGRYASKISDLQTVVSEYALIKQRLRVEIQWLITLASCDLSGFPKLEQAHIESLQAITDNFSLADAEKIKEIEQTTNHDVKAVEYFLREKLENDTQLALLLPFIHFACTSEDINNLAYALMLQEARDHHLVNFCNKLIQQLDHAASQYANIAMLARTHGQPASPTTLGKELRNVEARLASQLQQIQQIKILGKFNGAVGNFNAHHAAYPDTDWQQISRHFVHGFDLTWNAYTTQIEPHDYIAELMHAIMRFNTICIDLNRDIWGYISIGYFTQKKIEGEVGSSTMPHKINPIDFENSEGNLGIANAIAQHLANKLPVSRWQRDLSDSTVLRNVGLVFGYCALAYQSTLKGLAKLNANQQAIADDLATHWEVLAEAVQTVMRRYGITDAYEQLKAFTRGKPVTAELMQQFITEIDIPAEAKQELSKLTPEQYIGYANHLAG